MYVVKKYLLLINLKLKFKQVSCILSGNPVGLQIVWIFDSLRAEKKKIPYNVQVSTGEEKKINQLLLTTIL